MFIGISQYPVYVKNKVIAIGKKVEKFNNLS
jgi:hypothetical protein